MRMSVVEEAIRKAKGRVNAPLEFWGCTNSPINHADRFHTDRNYPNKMDLYLIERANYSIQEYNQQNSAMGGSRGSRGNQYGRSQTSSTTTCSMIEMYISQL